MVLLVSYDDDNNNNDYYYDLRFSAWIGYRHELRNSS